MWFWLCIFGGVAVLAGALVAGNKRRQRRALQGVKRRVKQRVAESKVEAAHRQQLERAALTMHGDGPTRLSRLKTVRCSAACWASTKPARDKHGRLLCDCPCRGDRHGGAHRKTAAVSQAAASPRPVSPQPVSQPAPSSGVSAPPRPKVRVQSQTEAPIDVQETMRRHAATSHDCRGGTVSVLTIRDRRTDPPTVSRRVTCDRCQKVLAG